MRSLPDSLLTKGTGMRIDLVDPQGTLLAEIADKRMTRDDVAMTYAFAIRQHAEVDWPTVNQAIMNRWSQSALIYIKTKAWKLIDARPAFDDQEGRP
jgi:hypothetical protein